MSPEEATRLVDEEIRGWTPRSGRRSTASPAMRYACRSLGHLGLRIVVDPDAGVLGIGANAAIFSVVNAALLRPLLYLGRRPSCLPFSAISQRPGRHEIPASAGEFADYRDRADAFEHVAAYDTVGFNLTGIGEPERLEGAVVTASLFPLLGASAQVVVCFSSAEQLNRKQVWRRATRLWPTAYSRLVPAIVGQMVALDGRPATRSFGAMPARFQYPDPGVEIWKPMLLDADALSEDNRGSHGYTALARFEAGVTLAQAHADLAAVTATFKAEHPCNYRGGFSANLRLLQAEIVGDTARPLSIFLAAVAVVPLIACANVANLLLARARSRRREDRAADGARRDPQPS